MDAPKEKATVQDSPQKKVRFVEGVNDAETIKRTGRPPISTKGQQYVSPTRIVVGKANPLRDLCIFATFMSIMIYSFSGVSSGSKKKNENGVDHPSTDAVGDALKVIAAALSTKRKEPCSVFLDRGTISRTGLSYFAGQDFTAGDALPLQTTDSLVLDDNLVISRAALILKHHPILINVKAVLHTSDNSIETNRFDLTATRNINAGEELFVSFDPMIHNMSLWSHIPHTEDYNLAYDIVRDAMGVAKVSTLPKSKRKRGASPSSVYLLLRRAVFRFNTRVANLLPASQKEAHDILEMSSSPTLALQNATISRLRSQGTCVQDVVKHSNGTSSVTKAFKKGETVSLIPVISVPRQEAAENCPQSGLGCFEHPLVRLCPALPFPNTVSSGSEPNVKWHWKYQGKLNEMAATEDWINGNKAEWMVLSVIALKDIAVGVPVGCSLLNCRSLTETPSAGNNR